MASDGGEAVIFYDGVCGLCNQLVRFVLARDPGGYFHFAALQSDYAREHLQRYDRDPGDLDTMYVLVRPGRSDERLLERSAAVFEVMRHLPAPWPMMTVLSWLPRALTDAAYRIVIRNRYRIWGRLEACPLPPADMRERFTGREVGASAN